MQSDMTAWATVVGTPTYLAVVPLTAEIEQCTEEQFVEEQSTLQECVGDGIDHCLDLAYR